MEKKYSKCRKKIGARRIPTHKKKIDINGKIRLFTHDTENKIVVEQIYSEIIPFDDFAANGEKEQKFLSYFRRFYSKC